MKSRVTIVVLSAILLLAGCKNEDPSLGDIKASDIAWLNAGLSAPDVSSFAISGNSIFAGSSFDGIFRSTGDAITWQESSNGIPIAVSGPRITVNKVTASNGLIFAAAAHDIFKSSDNGSTWTPAHGDLQATDAISLAGNEGVAYTIIDGSVFRSGDKGNSWDLVFPGIQFQKASDITILGDSVFISVAGQILSCNNSSGTFRYKRGLLPKPITTLVAHGDDLYAGTAGAGIYRLKQNSILWEYLGLTYENVSAIVFYNNSIVVGCHDSLEGQGGIFVSSDKGATWTGANQALPTNDITALAIFKNQLVAGTAGYGAYVSPL